MTRFVFLVSLLSLTLAACSDNNENNSSGPSYPTLPGAADLDTSKLSVGVGVYPGEAIAFGTNNPSRYKLVSEQLGRAMMHVQLYDELVQSFGEYTYYQAPAGAGGNGPNDYMNNLSLGFADQRASSLNAELDAANASASSTGFGQRSVVLDMLRLSDQWYVRWDGSLGGNSDGKGAYGLSTSAMYAAALDRAVKIATETQPEYMVIGSDMDLLLATDEAEGLSLGEFANFQLFYKEAAKKVREVSPNTKVGAGINWDRFATRVALSYTSKGDVNTLTDQDLDYAFRVALLPLIKDSDIVALKSYRAPGEASYYSFLRRLPALYNVNTPVVYYSIGSPLTGGTAVSAQTNYIADFLSWNAGVNVEAMFWSRLVNSDGTASANQELTGRCKALTDPTRDFKIPVSTCFDGLHNALFDPTQSGAAYLKLAP